MNKEEILIAYRDGNLSTIEAQEKLRELKQEAVKHPLSEGQKGLWILQKMAPEMCAYNVPFCFRIRRKLDTEKFKQACAHQLTRYPILTTVIREENGVPYQMVQPSQRIAFEQVDISTVKSDEMHRYLVQKAKEPFVLDRGPLMRIYLLSLSEQEHIVLIAIHHIIFDGSSVLPFITTLFGAYRDIAQGEKPAAAPDTASYYDFVEWERRMLISNEGGEHRAYWNKQLTGTLPVLELPVDRARPPAQHYNGQTYTRSLPPELAERVKSLAQSQQVNLSIVLLGLFKVLLHRYSGQEDIIVGMPTMGRPQERFEQLIGYFVNMIPVRSHLEEEQSFSALIRELELTVIDGLDHSVYPFPAMVRELNIPRTQAGSPVFQAAFVYQNFLQSATLKRLQELSIEFIEGIHQEGEYDVVLEIFEKEEEFVLNLKYNPDLFDSSTVARMMAHFVTLTEEAVKDPTAALAKYSLLPKDEYDTQVIEWNATQTDYPEDKCIHELFEQQSLKSPDAVAIVYNEESVSYRDLDEKSTCVAIYLQKQGVHPDSLVGICVERSLDMIVGLLGILKAGGAYVPLDPDYPAERLGYMLEDSKAAIVLTQSRFANKLSHVNRDKTKVIALDTDWDGIEREAKRAKTLRRDVKSDHLAYVLYTSGSTGNPKGVMISHASIMNTLSFLESKYPVTNTDAYLLKTNYVFDVSVSELFGWFMGGGRLIILPPGSEKSPEIIAAYIEKYKVTHINFVPAMLAVFLNGIVTSKKRIQDYRIKYLMVAGEAFPKELVQKATNIFKGAYVENIYGPTEVSIYASWFSCSKDKIVSGNTPIGKPIANTQLYIVDKHLCITPIGIPGELCVAGRGLARGYLNRPDLTAEKFIDNPFEPGTKLYKTGDLARRLPDGNIEYLGRKDHQVKIRGFRIELGEVESRLRAHPRIQDCAVLVQEQDGNRHLTAYYTTNEPMSAKEDLTSRELRNRLRIHLPEYMIPSFFIHVDKMPLTPSGKINRKELTTRKTVVRSTLKTSIPASDVEKRVLEIWEDILKVHDISTDDGFFDVGGDSLLAIAVAERIQKVLRCDFTVTTLFKHSNIKDIAKYIVEASHNEPNENRELYQAEQPDITDGLQRVAYPGYYQDSLAIIGISCQFPGAKNHTEFWKNLREGKESIRFFSKEEIRSLQLPEEIVQNPNYIPAQATIEGKDLFDPGFFHISPKDAEFMDPQLRLLLMHSWKAMEDAGYVPGQIPNTSVFMSASNSFYQALLKETGSQQFKILDNADEYVSWIVAQGGTIPTMISHKLGLNGPSFFVHSNCSSSLVGLYLAYRSLISGEARYALVGGSTILPMSNLGYVYQNGLNFSSDGHCKTFDASADGMIGGEGVAVIVLKRAVDAVRDGDHIYALLRGVGLNNDGSDKAGFYAPSVKGQADVIQKVVNQTKINPESISYVEAHGTGTKLGDPIEFNALNEVYKKYTTRKQFCGIGSVKSNIGHLDTAAGLAGAIKVALSLCYGEIPPSINYTTPNPNIDLYNSPFYVVDALRKWENTSTPPRAALSSFGLGGTNAHAIFEKYTPAPDSERTAPESGPQIIPLSAKNSDRLNVSARNLLHFLETSELSAVPHFHADLPEIAYSLQVGREAMDSRVVFIAGTTDELKQMLKDYIDGKEKIHGCFGGNANRSTDSTRFFDKDEDYKELIQRWIVKRKVRTLAELWAKGFHIDWELLHVRYRPRRISLPTYPFVETRYWLPEIKKRSTGKDRTGEHADAATIHPLLHKNTSDFSEQRFSSTFTGDEFFLNDHVIRGQKVLPGVAYIEMARAAVEQAVGAPEERQTGIRLKNIIWARPITVKESHVLVHIGLFPSDHDEIAYEIYSKAGNNGAQPVVHSQGVAVLSQIPEVHAMDLPALQAECNAGAVTSSQCYEAFKAAGIEYGPGHKGIEQVYMGQGQVLAKLALPDSVTHTQGRFVLHPSLMDAALQAAVVLMMSSGDPKRSGVKPALPFALQELEILGKCTSSMWALVRNSNGGKPGDKIVKNDIDLCDETGKVCVRMRGFSSRVLEGEIAATAPSETTGTLLLEPAWKEQAAASEATTPDYAKRVVMLCEPDDISQETIQTLISGVDCLILQSEQSGIEERFQASASRAFQTIQSILKDKPRDSVLVQVVVFAGREKSLFSALTGLLKTAHLENPKIAGQLIEAEPLDDTESIADKLEANGRRPDDTHIRYKDGKRYVASWREAKVSEKETKLPWKENGIYLITGGAGGLGRIFAKEIATKAKSATVILTGRAPVDDKKLELEGLEALNAQIEYRQADVTNKEAVADLIRGIQNDFGNLNGIIHSAGMIQDNFIIKKSEDEFLKVLAPKVAGLVNLDYASKDISLDFFVLFSSMTACMGNAGQADYSTANAFMDAYAKYRSDLVALKERRGITLSVNWPLWKEGGMRIDEKSEKLLMEKTGIIAMQTPTGIRALYQGILSNSVQLMVLEGKLSHIKQKVLSTTAPSSTSTPIAKEQQKSEQHGLPGENLKDKTISYLKQIISTTLKTDPGQMDIHTTLDKYGLDSVIVLDINNKLERHFADLPKTLFFEYSTINDLADYLAKSHQPALVKLLKIDNARAETEESEKNTHGEQPARQSHTKPARTRYLSKQQKNEQAVQSTVGISEILADTVQNLSVDDIIGAIGPHIITRNNRRQLISPVPDSAEYVLIHEKGLKSRPELEKLIGDIDRESPPFGYERLLYPYFFIVSNKKRYLRVIIDQQNKLIIPYMVLEESLYHELRNYSQRNNYRLLIVEGYHDWLDTDELRLIPLGVMQHLDINQLALTGNKMRKLRYLIDKFKQSGDVRTEEYDAGANLPLAEMRDVMIKWSEGKKNIIHHTYVCMEELLQKKLTPGYRAFITYYNNQVCSIVVVEKAVEGMYLMDQEFYDPQTAPLGHMEYAIMEIIEQLKKENAWIFSLGLTWYPFIFEDNPNKDPEGWAWLKEQNEKQTLLSRIFNQGKTNYQFKKKFGVAGEPVFGYLPHDAPFSLILNYWPVFYQNSITSAQLTERINKISLSDPEPKNEGDTVYRIQHDLNTDQRSELLSKTGKLEQIDYHASPLDLITDSWFIVQSDAVLHRADYLKEKAETVTREILRTIFPFKHIILTSQGRVAEQLFYQAFPKIRKRIVTAIPWTTTLVHQLANGYDVVELPCTAALEPKSTELFRGEMDLQTLEEQLRGDHESIAMAGLEVLSNATGGHPVRLSHILGLKKILQHYQIPLVLDASRIVRNAFLIRRYEGTYKRNSIFDIVKQIAGQAEHIVTSLTKDFAVPAGGLIATNDDALANDIQKIQAAGGLAITPDTENMIIRALAEKETIIKLITTQLSFTKRIHDMLVQSAAPVLSPAYGHAIVINTSQFPDGETNKEKKENFLRKLFVETGIRGGIHQVGKQKNSILDQCIRLAFPLGLAKEDEERIYQLLQHFFNSK